MSHSSHVMRSSLELVVMLTCQTVTAVSGASVVGRDRGGCFFVFFRKLDLVLLFRAKN